LRLFAVNQHKRLSMNNLRAKTSFPNQGQSSPIKVNQGIFHGLCVIKMVEFAPSRSPSRSGFTAIPVWLKMSKHGQIRPNTTHAQIPNGKISRLPRDIREQTHSQLRDGHSAGPIVQNCEL